MLAGPDVGQARHDTLSVVHQAGTAQWLACCKTLAVRQTVRLAEQRLTSGFKVEKNETVGPGGGDVCLEEGQGGCFCLWVHLAAAEPGIP